MDNELGGWKMVEEEGQWYLIHRKYNEEVQEKLPKNARVNYMDDYVDALTKAVSKKSVEIRDKQEWQNFCENFTNYIDEESKTKLNFWEEFQLVSRDFKEFHLENVLKEELILELLKNRGSDEIWKVKQELEFALGKIAIKVTANNPNLISGLYYDPIMEVIDNDFHEFNLDTKENMRNIADKKDKRYLEQEKGYPTEDPVVFEYEVDAHVKNLGFAYQHRADLNGRLILFDYYGNFHKKLPWEKSEQLKQAWEEYKEITLTPVKNPQRNKEELMEAIEAVNEQQPIAKIKAVEESNPIEVVKESKPMKQGKQYLIHRDNEVNLEKHFSENDQLHYIDHYAAALMVVLDDNSIEKRDNPKRWQRVCENFTDYIDEKTNKELPFLNEFQTLSREFQEFHLENALKDLDFSIYELNSILGKMAIEMVKKKPELNFCTYYDPVREAIKHFINDRNCRAEDIRELVEDLLKDLDKGVLYQEKAYATSDEYEFCDANDPFVVNMRYLYQNKDELDGRVKLFDYYGNFHKKQPWEKNEQLKQAWEEYTEIKLTPPGVPRYDELEPWERAAREAEEREARAARAARVARVAEEREVVKEPKPMEQGKQYLIHRDNEVNLEKYFSENDQLHYIDRYVDALTDVLVKYSRIKIKNSEIWQDICENFTDYIGMQTKKTLPFLNEFQTLSREFQEFHLENLSHTNDREEIKYELNSMLGKMAIEMVKKKAELNFYFCYDPVMEVIKDFDLSDEDNVDPIRRLVENLLKDPDNGVLYQEKAYATSDKQEFRDANNPFVVNMRYLYQNKEQLEGRIQLFDYYGNFHKKLPWEKSELEQVWKEYKEIALTPVENPQRNKQELGEAIAVMEAMAKIKVVKEPNSTEEVKKQKTMTEIKAVREPDQVEENLNTLSLRASNQIEVVEGANAMNTVREPNPIETGTEQKTMAGIRAAKEQADKINQSAVNKATKKKKEASKGSIWRCLWPWARHR